MVARPPVSRLHSLTYRLWTLPILHPLKIVGILDDPENADFTAAGIPLIVMINNHALRVGSAEATVSRGRRRLFLAHNSPKSLSLASTFWYGIWSIRGPAC